MWKFKVSFWRSVFLGFLKDDQAYIIGMEMSELLMSWPF